MAFFPEDDNAFEAASRLAAATPEQLETHAVATALRLNRAGEEFMQSMNRQAREYATLAGNPEVLNDAN